MLRVFYASKTNDANAKRKNKLIAEAAKLTIKIYGEIEVWSSKTERLEGKIKNPETIIPGWGGVDFELDDEINYKVGLVLNKKVGDTIIEGEELLKIYLNKIHGIILTFFHKNFIIISYLIHFIIVSCKHGRRNKYRD